ncbi:hypothetical protein [Marisediminicola sp. LYQ85]|uniref:hypothetical protein n=1 Tax=Marisediminicola sp. LYQ85 TaxID=3391062 RepID=UPI003982FF50
MVLTGLLASARELRFPLTVGYSALLSVWLLFGEVLAAAARKDALGRRVLTALDSLGGTAEVGLYTFVAAMLGSVLWHGGVARLVRYIAARGGHPNWEEMIDQARRAARQYGEYRVTTNKGASGGQPSPFDATHTVPSPEWGAHLLERVQERERKAAEMSFRVTLALALVPISLALGLEGGGLWWLSLVAIPVIWLDITMLKHTTLRVVHRYKLEDLQERLRSSERELNELVARVASVTNETADGSATKWERNRILELQKQSTKLNAAIDEIKAHTNRRASRIFALIEGEPAEYR